MCYAELVVGDIFDLSPSSRAPSKGAATAEAFRKHPVTDERSGVQVVEITNLARLVSLFG